MGGGELAKKIRLKPKLSTLCKIRPFFCYFKHEIQLFGTSELKSSQIWHKNVFKFFKFSGTNLSWGDKPWSKNRDKCRMGGFTKFSPDWRDPHPPTKKKKNMDGDEKHFIFIYSFIYFFIYLIFYLFIYLFKAFKLISILLSVDL